MEEQSGETCTAVVAQHKHSRIAVSCLVSLLDDRQQRPQSRGRNVRVSCKPCQRTRVARDKDDSPESTRTERTEFPATDQLSSCRTIHELITLMCPIFCYLSYFVLTVSRVAAVRNGCWIAVTSSASCDLLEPLFFFSVADDLSLFFNRYEGPARQHCVSIRHVRSREVSFVSQCHAP